MQRLKNILPIKYTKNEIELKDGVRRLIMYTKYPQERQRFAKYAQKSKQVTCNTAHLSKKLCPKTARAESIELSYFACKQCPQLSGGLFWS